MRISLGTSPEAIYNDMCSLAQGRLTAEEFYHIGRSLLILGLSKLEPAEREAELNDLPEYIDCGLDGLDALKARKKLNGHGPKGGLAI